MPPPNKDVDGTSRIKKGKMKETRVEKNDDGTSKTRVKRDVNETSETRVKKTSTRRRTSQKIKTKEIHVGRRPAEIPPRAQHIAAEPLLEHLPNAPAILRCVVLINHLRRFVVAWGTFKGIRLDRVLLRIGDADDRPNLPVVRRF